MSDVVAVVQRYVRQTKLCGGVINKTVKHKSDMIMNGFYQLGILDAIHSHGVDADSEEV